MLGSKLEDYSSSGRKRPWKKHKSSNYKLFNILRLLQEYDKAHKIADCSNVLTFGECPDGHGKWLKKAYFCKDRLCYICSWRKSLFIFHQFLQIAHKTVEIYPGTKFAFITLTVKNCPLEDLGKTITQMNGAIARLIKYTRIKAAYKGMFRSLEVTYNAYTNTFHPHIHAVAAVNKSYFTSCDYISQPVLCSFWGKALGQGYDPICWIKRVKAKKKGVNTVTEDIAEMDRELAESFPVIDAAAETAKYSVKMADILSPTIKKSGKHPDSEAMIEAKLRLRSDLQKQAEILGYLINGLYKRRLVAYTGIFKEVSKLLKLNCEDVEKSDLIHMPGEEDKCACPICQSELIQIQYAWDSKNYINKGVVKTTNNPIFKKGLKRDTSAINF